MKRDKCRGRLLAMDPGKDAFAWCLVSCDGKNLSFGMLQSTISDIRDQHVNNHVRRFKRAITKLFDACGELDEVVVERFQQRPAKGGGGNAEYINIMIGVIAVICLKRNLRLTLVQASTWKNHMSSHYSPIIDDGSKRKKFEKQTQAERYGYKVSKTSKTAPIKDHEFDACGIANWIVEKRSNKPMLKVFKKQLDETWKARDAKTKKLKQAKRKRR
jgi:hypothetical protein